MKTVALLLWLALMTGPPAVAQTPATSAAPDSLAGHVAAYTDYLTAVVRLSTRQRQQVAALLTEQLRHPEQVVAPVAWLRVLSLHQYQLWQSVAEPLELSRRRPTPEPLLARQPK